MRKPAHKATTQCLILCLVMTVSGGRFLAAYPGQYAALVTSSRMIHRHTSLALYPPAKARYVPKPRTVDTGKYLLGALMCPLWRQTSATDSWAHIVPFPEREPILGWYDEGNPEVTDWEIKFAREHGIRFFAPCWFRAAGNLGQPVRPLLDHWIQGFLRSRYAKQMRYALMWENSNSIACDVQDEKDLLGNLLPYWIEHYFRTSSYLQIDGKPVVYIYTPSRLVQDLGGETNARSAIRKMRSACVAAGFKGLLLLGCDNAVSLDTVKQMANLGLDYSFSYHWPTFGPFRPPLDSLTPPRMIQAQEKCWQVEATGALPNILTISMGWDDRPWGGKALAWQLPPADFQTLCTRAKATLDARKGSGLESRMLLVDNWNEFGEGHYIFPTRQYGFGFLDALRNIFASGNAPHRDIVPSEIGLGPYDSLYRAASRTLQY